MAISLATLVAGAAPALAAEAHQLSKTFGTATSTPPDPYPLNNPTDVAVDNSHGPSRGDIYVADPSRDEQQAIALHSEPGGTFTLTFEGETTRPIKTVQFSGDRVGEVELQNALNELPALGAGNVSVGEISQATVTFTGKFTEQDVPQLTCNPAGLTGPGAACTVTTTVTAAPGNFVEKLSPSGQFISMIGRGVNKTAVEEGRPEAEQNLCPDPGKPADVCGPGARGTAPGSFTGEQQTEGGDALAEEKLVRLSRLYLAVDDGGSLYVGDPGDHLITKFDEAGKVVSAWGSEGQLPPFTGAGGAETFHGLAVDAADNDLFVWTPLSEGGNVDVHSYTETGAPRSGPFERIIHRGLGGLAVDADEVLYPGAAVDPTTNDRYLLKRAEAGDYVEHLGFHCHGEEVLGTPCTPLEEFGAGGLNRPEDVAAGPEGAVYIADTGAGDVALYTPQSFELPTASADAASEVAFTSAHLTGEVDPMGTPTTCRFEAVTEAHFQAERFEHRFFTGEGGTEGSKESRSQQEREKAEETEGYEPPVYVPCATEPGSGTGPVPVEATLTRLMPGTIYHLRLLAKSRLAAEVPSEPGPTFTTEAVVAPTVTIEAPVVTGTGATFAGHINPNAPQPVTPAIEAGFEVEWHFSCTPRCQTAEEGGKGGTLAAGDAPDPVSVGVTGLEPGTEYQVTLTARNSGFTETASAHFTTASTPPTVDSTYAASVGPEGATLASQLRAGGQTTTYRYQYITEEAFAADGGQFGEGTAETPEQALPDHDNKDQEATAGLTGLRPETAYRYRVLAHNPLGTPAGPIETLYTYVEPSFGGCGNETLREQNLSSALPDCRAFEQASPAGHGAAYQPYGPISAGSTGLLSAGGIFATSFPMQTSASGEALVYIGEPAGSGEGGGTGNSANGEGDQILTTRSAGGWQATDISPLGADPASYYEAFSADLARGELVSSGERLVPQVETDCSVIYSRQSGSGALSPFFTGESAPCSPSFFVGASADGSQQLFESAAALPTEGPHAQAAEGHGHENIYDSSAGVVRLVNLLPGGSHKAIANATLGALTEEEELVIGSSGRLPPVNLSGAVSTDASRAYWTDLANDIVYLRENPGAEPSAETAGHCLETELACTVQVSAGAATYQAATPDGRLAYYTESGRLFRFDLGAFEEATAEGKTLKEADTLARTALTPAGAEVQGVVGLNETGPDGAYLYLVANGAIAANVVENGAGPEAAQIGKPNLYLLHEGSLTFIAGLASTDNKFANYLSSDSDGDWRAVLGYRSAQPSADGSHLVFMSTRRLTAYDNASPASLCGENGHGVPTGGVPCAEVYVYAAAAGRLACASCTPTGVPPDAVDTIGISGFGTYIPIDQGNLTHVHRVISADGTRVFFDTYQALTPADDNGEQDVYEWEAPGSGSCAHGSPLDGGGCVYLVSGGKPGGYSYLLESDAEGKNAFFGTRAPLISSDRDEIPDIYDARVEGGFPPPAEPPPCEAEGCRGATPGAPSAQSSATSHFQGSEVVSPTCRNGQVRRKGRCVKKPTKRKHHKGKHRSKHAKNHHRQSPGKAGGHK